MLCIMIWSLHNVYSYQNSTLYTRTVTSRKANQFSTTGPFETYLTYLGFFLFFLLKVTPFILCWATNTPHGDCTSVSLRTGISSGVLIHVPWVQHSVRLIQQTQIFLSIYTLLSYPCPQSKARHAEVFWTADMCFQSVVPGRTVSGEGAGSFKPLQLACWPCLKLESTTRSWALFWYMMHKCVLSVDALHHNPDGAAAQSGHLHEFICSFSSRAYLEDWSSTVS